jgi:alpha-beta hydrolase superfamily lysophospholipase
VYLCWLGLALLLSVPTLLAGWLGGLYFYLRMRYLHLMVRIFQEKPLFVVPRGRPLANAEPVRFLTRDGLLLSGCYLRTARPRRGVILFGIEFGSNCWSCHAYCEHLVRAGFDVFAFEPRNQGDSERMAGYDPLPWVTTYEIHDTEAAVAYLKSRPDADPEGIGFFGISKGAGAGLFVASRDPYIRCCVTDGVFGTYSTMVPYMRQWFRIYSNFWSLQGVLPSWYYGMVGLDGLRQIERERHCRFPHLERIVGRLSPRPLLMIHGEADNYIKAEMAQVVFERAGEPKEFWLVEGAKHNQALHLAGEEYRNRVLRFFEQHLVLGDVVSETRRSEPLPQPSDVLGAEAEAALFPR